MRYVHVEDELVTQTYDCSRVNYLKDSLAQIACGREAHAQNCTDVWQYKRVNLHNCFFFRETCDLWLFGLRFF